MSWEPIAKHGDSEAQVRERLEAENEAALLSFQRELREAGLNAVQILKALDFARSYAAQQLERALPGIMRDMALTAGAESLH